ncbi:hypothetical protein ACFL4G_04555 [Thermodesulfobacteriota bacterium]
MMYRRKKAFEVSLFPFLGVLLCVIGVLVMLIIGATLGTSLEKGAFKKPIIPTPEEVADQRNVLEELSEKIQIQDKLLDDLLAMLRDFTSLEDHLKKLRARLEENENTKLSLEEQLKAMISQILEAAKKLKEKRNEEDTADGKAILTFSEEFIGESNLKPIPIDCRKGGIVIMSSGKYIATSDIEGSRYLKKMLKNMKKSDTWCVCLLIRRGGVPSYEEVIKEVREKKIPHGMYPLNSVDDFHVNHLDKPDWL